MRYGKSGKRFLADARNDKSFTFAPLREVSFGDESFSAGSTANSGLNITYISNNTPVAVTTNGMIKIKGVGTAIITASQSGKENYHPAENISQTLIVSKADQFIAFNPFGTLTYGDLDFNPGGTASSGLSVTYTSNNTNVAVISGNSIQIVGAGSADITASQSGNQNYNPAEDIIVKLTVAKAILTITADNKTKAFLSANPIFTYTCSGFVNGENIAVLDIAPSAGANAVVDSPSGDYIITVSGGNDNRYDFIYVTGILTITKISQTITFTSFPKILYVNETFELTAVATSGLPVSFESKDIQIARVTGETLVGISRGNTGIRAYQSGNENYNATEAEISVEIVSTHENILYLFTPNGDGFNDFWEIPDLGSFRKCEVRVYNRWGKLVFSSMDYHNEWDGTSNGVSLPSAAYYFIIKSETAGTITGTVNIAR